MSETHAEPKGSVFEKFMDPCDIYLPPEVASELLRCATRNGRIAYEYLLGIYRKGRADALAALPAPDARPVGDWQPIVLDILREMASCPRCPTCADNAMTALKRLAPPAQPGGTLGTPASTPDTGGGSLGKVGE